MKKLTLIVMALMMAVCGASAKRMSDLKIYINPGHGGYTSDDRPIQIYPFPSNDTLGYWESKSNLYKGLHMYHILDSLGAKPYLSRTKNTQDDDRSLSGIAAEANQLGVDLFFSIHSNAGESVNYPLMLYRENSIGTPRYPENVTLSEILGKNLYSNKLPVWTHNYRVCGDLDFYKNMWQGGLGVLRTLYVVGLLSEGSMHEHRPEAHRLMNDDVLWLEAWHFVKSIMEFYGTEDRFVTGNVAGVVYDNHNKREKYYPVNFHMFGRDNFAVLNGATVELRDLSGNVVQRRTTDDMNNGCFVFRNVAPGNYMLYAVRSDYHAEQTPVTVTANEVTYQDMAMTLDRPEPLKVTAYAPAVTEGQEVSCSTTIDIDFNYDVDTESFEQAVTIEPAVAGRWVYSNSYGHAQFIPDLSFERSTLYTVTIGTGAKHTDTYNSAPNLPEPVVFSFTTKGRDRLELTDQFPVDGGQVHYKAPLIELRFDAKVDQTTVYDGVTVTDSKGNTVAMNKRGCKFNQLTNGFGNALISLPQLTVGETYTVAVSTTIRDNESLPLSAAHTYTFTAIDATQDVVEGAVVVDDFESAHNLAYDEEQSAGMAAKPTFTKSTSYKLFGSSAARFGYSFSQGHDGVLELTYTGQPIPYNTGDQFGVYVNGDFNNHELWVAMTSGTNVKYAKVCDLNFLGWQHRTVILDNLEADFCPFLLSGFRLVQVTSPITQKGYVALDNVTRKDSETGGVDDIIANPDAAAPVQYYNLQGIPVSAGDLTPGLYLRRQGAATVKVTVK